MGSRNLHRLCRKGGIPKHFNLRVGRPTLVVYAYDIESPLARRWQQSQVFPHYLRYFPPFVAIYSRFRRLHITRPTRLNLDKTKNIVFPCDQVDLSPAAWCPEVAGYDLVAQSPEVKVSGYFPTLSCALMCRTPVRWKQSHGKAFQTSHDRLRNAGGKHWLNSSNDMQRREHSTVTRRTQTTFCRSGFPKRESSGK
jgi:hypothetical protein